VEIDLLPSILDLILLGGEPGLVLGCKMKRSPNSGVGSSALPRGQQNWRKRKASTCLRQVQIFDITAVSNNEVLVFLS
jgi:hypothetical protein